MSNLEQSLKKTIDNLIQASNNMAPDNPVRAGINLAINQLKDTLPSEEDNTFNSPGDFANRIKRELQRKYRMSDDATEDLQRITIITLSAMLFNNHNYESVQQQFHYWLQALAEEE